MVMEPFFFCFSLRHRPGNELSVTGGDQPVYQTLTYSGNVAAVTVNDPEKGTPNHSRFDLNKVKTDNWIQIALTWDFTGPANTREMKFYVDGTLAGVSRYNGPLPKKTPALYLGGRPGRISNVCLDELRIWSEPKVYETMEMPD